MKNCAACASFSPGVSTVRTLARLSVPSSSDISEPRLFEFDGSVEEGTQWPTKVGVIFYWQVFHSSNHLISDLSLKLVGEGSISIGGGVVQNVIPVVPLSPCQLMNALQQEFHPSFASSRGDVEGVIVALLNGDPCNGR